jgi:hypothetical protein
MSARLLVAHQRGPDAIRIEVVSGVVQQALPVSLEQPRRKSLADQSALPVAAVGVETVTDHPPAITHYVCNHSNERAGHARKVDISIGD